MAWRTTNGSFYSHRNIFIPGQGVVYVAPEGIRHYIGCHDYLPPASFCAAVLASPEVDSPEYFAALRASGFRDANPDEPKAIRHGGMGLRPWLRLVRRASFATELCYRHGGPTRC